MAKEAEICHHCGAKIVEYPHVLNAPLVSAFKNLVHAGGRENLQKINLTKNQYTNFQKLKYWGIVQSCREDGMWEVTPTGYDFFSSAITLQKKVYTYRNKVVSFEGDLISIRTFLSGDYFQTDDYIKLSRGHNNKTKQMELL